MQKDVLASLDFRVQITASHEEAEPVWRDLETTGNALVFQTYDWQAAWYRILGRRQRVQPCLAIVRTVDDRPLMLLPLGIVRRGPGRVLIWLGGDLTDYNGPVLAPGAAAIIGKIGVEHLWQRLRRELPAFDYADFQRQPAEIADQENPLRQLSTHTDPISGCFTRLEPNWESYHRSKRGADTRRKERRKEAKLVQHGPIDFVIARTAADIDPVLSAMVAQKSASYRRKGVKNLFRDPVYVDFLKAFTLDHAESGRVVLAAIRVEGEIIATQWGLVHGDRFYCLVYSHDNGRFARYSPGNVLLRRLLAWCCERGIAIFDFTYGEEPYKDHWCEGRLALHDSLLPSTLLGRVLVVGVKGRKRMRRVIKRFSHLHAFAAHIRKLWYNALPKPSIAAGGGQDADHREAAGMSASNAGNEWTRT